MFLPFLLYQLKVAVLFMLLYIFFRLFLARESFHAFNRVVVLLSIFIASLLPVFRIAVHIPLPSRPLDDVLLGGAAVSEAGPGSLWPVLLLSIYIVGVLSVLASVMASIFSISGILSKAVKIPQQDGTVLAIVDRQVSPMSWMKYIILSKEDYAECAESILIHEKAHIFRKHSIDVLLADIFTAMQWFNPAAWMMREDLRAIHEYEADEQVIKSGIDAKQYQLLLVKKAFGANGRSVSNNFNNGKLKKRITMMLSPKTSAFKALKFLYVVPLVCAGLALNARTVYDVPDTLSNHTVNGTMRIKGSNNATLSRDVKIYIDGQPVSKEQMNSLDPENISSVVVIKNDSENAIYVYSDDYTGPRQSGGAVSDMEVKISTSGTSDDAALQGKVNKVVINSTGEMPDMDIYVDGKKVEAESFTKISTNDIESVIVDKSGEKPSLQVFLKKE